MTPPALRSLLDAFAARDLNRALACFEEDAFYREASGSVTAGRAAIAARFAAFAAHGRGWEFHVDDVIADGLRACVVYRFALAEGEAAARRERAGVALVHMGVHDLIAEWREYESS